MRVLRHRPAHRRFAFEPAPRRRAPTLPPERTQELNLPPAVVQRWLDRLVGPLVNQPLSRPVPADDLAYRRRKGDGKLAVRALRNELRLLASGQAALRRERIDPAWRRALWIHEEAPQIGDALMDLAPRTLLAEAGIAVDLHAPGPLAALFADDPWFGRSLADPEAIDAARYDFVIASSDARRALATKRRRLPRLPWVSLAGRYAVPDYQRGMFDARRLADLLDRMPTDEAMAFHALQKLGPVRAAVAPLDRADDRPRIAIACGGVHAERTYPHWPQVAEGLAARGRGTLALVGSANGRAAADAILDAMSAGSFAVHDHVARHDLHATRSVIEAADLLVCADGGLLHLGLTTGTPVVALFTATVDPAWRLPIGFEGAALRSATPTVADIGPGRIAEVVVEVLSRSSAGGRTPARGG